MSGEAGAAPAGGGVIMREKLFQIVIAIIATFLLALFFWMIGCVSINIMRDPQVQPVPCPPNMSPQEKKETDRFLNYHGTLTCRDYNKNYIVDGRWYFKRDGILCKLWNPDRR